MSCVIRKFKSKLNLRDNYRGVSFCCLRPSPRYEVMVPILTPLADPGGAMTQIFLNFM